MLLIMQRYDDRFPRFTQRVAHHTEAEVLCKRLARIKHQFASCPSRDDVVASIDGRPGNRIAHSHLLRRRGAQPNREQVGLSGEYRL